MANRARDDEKKNAPVKKSAAPVVIPIALLVVTLGLGAYVVFGPKKEAAAPPPAPVDVKKPTPFADMPPEKPPVAKSSRASDGKVYPPAPEGLLEDANWKKALALASEGEALFTEAIKARASENMALYNEKGNAAEAKFDDAVTLTAEWEEKLVAQYGDRDAQIATILQTRSAWIKKMLVLSKTTGR